MSSPAWVVSCTGCKCVITCFAIDPQAEHMNVDAKPPRESAQVSCPCCEKVYRYVAKDIRRGIPKRNEQCRLNGSTAKPNGALLVAASIVAAIRLRGEPIKPSPKLTSTVSDSVQLARLVLAELGRR
jgi:hypothetical protein